MKDVQISQETSRIDKKEKLISLLKGTGIQNLAVTNKSYHYLAPRLCFNHKQPKNRRGEKEGDNSLNTGCFLDRSALFGQIMHDSPLA